MKLTSAQLDRACGALLGSAAGDALGAGYEFSSARLGPTDPQMIGGGLGDFAPGEWTDDTTMAWCIAEVAARQFDLRSTTGLTEIARNFRSWYESRPPDIGVQTSQVLRSAGPDPTGDGMSQAARSFHASQGQSGGNGSLMRTAPTALPYLDDPSAIAEAARTVSALTHFDPDAGDACVLWSLAIRYAILHGAFDVRVGLPFLSADQATRWAGLIDEAEREEPTRFTPNGWVVRAFQAAWSAITHTPTPEDDPCGHLVDSLTTAIAIGNDTDTVAAIAGALLGARWGASAVPARWRRVLHGYPGITGDRLEALATLAANHGPIVYDWPLAERVDYSMWNLSGTLAQHPFDDDVWLGDSMALDHLPDSVTAVVSLCLLGDKQRPAVREHICFRLVDKDGVDWNTNLDFVIRDAADTVAALRAEGHSVFVHCVAAHSRTPTVAIAYALRLGVPVDEATARILAVLPEARPRADFRDALRRIASRGATASSRQNSSIDPGT